MTRLWSPFDPETAIRLTVWPVWNFDVLLDPGRPGPRLVPRARRHTVIDTYRPSEEPTCSLANFAPPWMWSWVPVVPFSEMTDTGLFTGDPDYEPERKWPQQHQRRRRKLGPGSLLTRAGPTPGLR